MPGCRLAEEKKLCARVCGARQVDVQPITYVDGLLRSRIKPPQAFQQTRWVRLEPADVFVMGRENDIEVVADFHCLEFVGSGIVRNDSEFDSAASCRDQEADEPGMRARLQMAQWASLKPLEDGLPDKPRILTG
jgi:hypothetical protein